MIWKPNVTVAAILERDGKFLLVEEESATGLEYVDNYPDQPLDTGIVRAIWMTLDDIRRSQNRRRSPLVLRCVEDCLAGKHFPLDLLVHYA